MDQSHTEKQGSHTPIEARMPILKVVGLGGGGQNAIDRMIELGISGVEFIAANTDAQVLQSSQAHRKVQLGPKLTRGLGAGGNPEIGQAAAEESNQELSEVLKGADMVFLTAGMGGGTGTGAIGVVAKIAKSLGAIVIAIVSLPFSFEVGKRQINARDGLTQLQPYTDTMICVPNDRLLQCAPVDLSLEMAFRMADDILRQGVQGISELITQPGLINVDFAHIRNLMKGGGGSLLAIGSSEGENRVMRALEAALHHPMLETINLADARGIIMNISGGANLPFVEVTEALTYLQEQTGSDVEIIPGVITDERMEERVQVILVLTGIGATSVDSQQVEMTSQPGTIKQEEYLLSSLNAELVNPFISSENTPVGFAPRVQNKDIPAFIRRRMGT